MVVATFAATVVSLAVCPICLWLTRRNWLTAKRHADRAARGRDELRRLTR